MAGDRKCRQRVRPATASAGRTFKIEAAGRGQRGLLNRQTDFGLSGNVRWEMPRIDKRKQLVVLSGRRLDDARRARGFTMETFAELAGAGYGSVWRALSGHAIGPDVALKIARSLGFELADVTATDAERRPAAGYSDEAMEHFRRRFRVRIRQAIRECHRATAAEASRRCWFWPSRKAISQQLTLRQRTGGGEVVLL